MRRPAFTALLASCVASGLLHAQGAKTTTTPATKAAGKTATARGALSAETRDSLAADSAAKAFLVRDDQFFADRVMAQRRLLLKGAAWADLGDRCAPGALRIFPRDTSAVQRDSLQKLVEHMEQTIVGRGAGARLDTPEARALLRVIVGWEAGIDRPLWDVDDNVSRQAVATGLTGEVPDPRGTGCLASPLAADTVTFVIPGFATMDFPKAPRPRVKAYFGVEAQKRARDEFYVTRGRANPESELSYILIAPIVLWREWALVGVDRPREKAGIELGSGSNGGAVYLMRRTGGQWRLTTIVRTWGS